MIVKTLINVNSAVQSNQVFNKFIKFGVAYDFTQINDFMQQINSCIEQIHRSDTHVSLQTNTNTWTIDYINLFNLWIHRLRVIIYIALNVDEFIWHIHSWTNSMRTIDYTNSFNLWIQRLSVIIHITPNMDESI